MGRKVVPDSARGVFASFDNAAVALMTESQGGEVGRIMKDVIQIDPRQIHREGTYVRNWRDDGEFEVFCRGVIEHGSILEPIGIREVGKGFDVRYVLVYGSQRLEAALRGDFPSIPARNHGPISETEAVLLQAMENDLRNSMHVVDRALTYWYLEESGAKQVDIARAFGRDDGYVSVLCRTGQALAKLGEEERAALYVNRRVGVRTFQHIAKADLASRVRMLRDLLNHPPAPKAPAPSGPFRSKATRDGRRFTYQWNARQVAKDPLAQVQALLDGLAQEAGALDQALADLKGNAEAGKAREQLGALLRLQQAR